MSLCAGRTVRQVGTCAKQENRLSLIVGSRGALTLAHR